MRDYIGIANKYIDDVLSEKIPACYWVKQACARQKRDLETLKNFHFNKKRASKVCFFCEFTRHTKGSLKGQRIVLEPWQIFIVTTVYGWVDDKGFRRFKRVYVEVPRGNGKSALSSALSLYMTGADDEGGAECYTFATTGEQARVVFDVAKQMLNLCSDVRTQLGMTVQARQVTQMKSGSILAYKSSEGSTLDGLNTHFACIDELHAHKTRDLYDVVETSIGKRMQPILWVITTAGFDSSGICYEVRSIVTMVLNQTIQDESQFGIIYTIDDGDDWTSDDALRKANPNWGVSVNPQTVTELRDKALVAPSAVNNFKTKHLNIWCSAKAAWMDMQKWRACEDQSLSIDDFSGASCTLGLDLASKNDIAAKLTVFPQVRDDGKTEYCIFPQFYLPEQAVLDGKNSQYSGWVSQGYIKETPGAMTDLSLVESDVRDELSCYDVRAIAYDPWQAVQMASNLSNDGAPMVEFRNTVQNISEPMKTVEALVLGGLIRHDGNPVMTWMMGNVVAKLDAKDNIYPRKERYENKIDGPVALIFAIAMLVNGIEAEQEEDISEFIDNFIVV